ncbi:MAG: HAD hydrolase-like protein [Candidatus Paceibacterota bacterium]
MLHTPFYNSEKSYEENKVKNMINNIIFDWKRTLYNPDDGTLIEGAKEILEVLQHKNIPLTLIGKGNADMYREVKRLEVEKYFSNIIFQDGLKENSLFEPYISKDDPSSTFFIGDRVKSELAVGKSLGATTVWVRQGKFSMEEPENENQMPDYVVTTLIEVKDLLINKFHI